MRAMFRAWFRTCHAHSCITPDPLRPIQVELADLAAATERRAPRSSGSRSREKYPKGRNSHPRGGEVDQTRPRPRAPMRMTNRTSPRCVAEAITPAMTAAYPNQLGITGTSGICHQELIARHSARRKLVTLARPRLRHHVHRTVGPDIDRPRLDRFRRDSHDVGLTAQLARQAPALGRVQRYRTALRVGLRRRRQHRARKGPLGSSTALAPCGIASRSFRDATGTSTRPMPAAAPKTPSTGAGRSDTTRDQEAAHASFHKPASPTGYRLAASTMM